jgi:hypothetical protein
MDLDAKAAFWRLFFFGRAVLPAAPASHGVMPHAVFLE